MKIAIVHDELVRRGGAEQVVLSLQKAFPEAPVYTLCYNPLNTYSEFKNSRIITSWFQKLGRSEKLVKALYFPFAILAMRSFYLKNYDVVIVSTTHCAKFIRVKKNIPVITYCHTPFRLAWRPASYENMMRHGMILRFLFLRFSALLKITDKMAAKRTDWYLANSKEVRERIMDAYHPAKEITIIHPPVKAHNFYVAENTLDYYLIVCRLEPYKKADLVVQAFNEMPGKKLIVVGRGSMEDELKKNAGDNILFLNSLNAEEIAKLYAECRAFIFPQHEDYGITPLESAASGRPVIAYGAGGVLETMIPYNGNNMRQATSVFFDEQSVAALKKAVHLFETLSFDTRFIRAHAEKFDESVFVEKITNYISDK